MEKNNDQEKLTTEAVSAGHPDKIADRISEKMLDFFLEKDENAHVACEVFVTKKSIILGGEIKTNFKIDDQIKAEIKQLIQDLLKKEIGYNETSWKELNKLEIKFFWNQQSEEIDQMVSKKNHQVGAGDNCTTFGYANNDKNYFPIFQNIANNILQKIHLWRKKELKWQRLLQFAPDGKIQIIYQEDKIIEIVLCQQVLKNWTPKQKEENKKIIREKIIKPILILFEFKEFNFDLKIIDFQLGGPASDTGLTGRKIIVDSYGTGIPHGGGCLAGKDPSKTDKSLSLFARYVAKHIVALGLAEEITIQISSIIGKPELVNITCLKNDAFTHNKKLIKRIIRKFFWWDLEKIINKLDLKQQKYFPFSKYGYFGSLHKEPSWEKLDLLKKIKTELNKFT